MIKIQEQGRLLHQSHMQHNDRLKSQILSSPNSHFKFNVASLWQHRQDIHESILSDEIFWHVLIHVIKFTCDQNCKDFYDMKIFQEHKICWLWNFIFYPNGIMKNLFLPSFMVRDAVVIFVQPKNLIEIHVGFLIDRKSFDSHTIK